MSFESYMNTKVLKQESIGPFFLSTVRIPRREDQEDLYETCLFREDGDYSSEVIGREYDAQDALICHERVKLTLMFVRGL